MAVETLKRLIGLFPDREADLEYKLAVSYDCRSAAHFSARRYLDASSDAEMAGMLAPGCITISFWRLVCDAFHS